MANKKPARTSDKKSSTKSKTEAAKTAKVKPAVVTSEEAAPATGKAVFKGFFAKKGDPDETILTIFKKPRIYGALMGELIGTMLLAMLLLTLGVQPLYILFGCIGIYLAVFTLSGANLNPLVTVAMMVTRRMSVIRGVLYILAQVVGAWFGLLIINGFRLGSGTETELPAMGELTGDIFWVVALVELVGAFIIGFAFVRALQYKRKPLAFAFTVTSAITLAIIVGIVVSQSFFEFTETTFVYNPAIALMYQILPTAADNFGQLMGNICLALLAYVIFPMVGGIIGFFISDVASKLNGECCCMGCACCKKEEE
ncbi:aquaporin [Candidatus Saccharibacteria bacterium]|nr:aquaporin [Candidatus Saccharibacteria bacterium]